jgi:hypothetical protein
VVRYLAGFLFRGGGREYDSFVGHIESAVGYQRLRQTNTDK